MRPSVQWTGGLLLGAMIGLACAATSPVLVLLAALAVATATVVIVRPEVGALAVVCLALVVPHDLLFRHGVPLGGGSLKLTDVLIGLSLAGWAVHRAIDPRARRLPSAPVAWLLVVLLALAFLAVGTNATRGGSLQLALTDLRPLLALSLVFPFVAFLDRGVSLEAALCAVLAACALGALWIAVLYVGGEGSSATYSSGAIRVTEVAFVAPLIGAIWALVLLPNMRSFIQRLTTSLLAAVCLAGLFFTLQRAAWLALILAVVISAFLMTPLRRRRLLGSLAVLMISSGVAIALINGVSSAQVANPFASGLERIQSIGSYGEDVSALHREAEFKEARKQVEHHPITGIGLGGELTFFSPMYNPSTEQPGIQFTTTYIHNSYTWMAVKTGLPGLLALVALVVVVLARALVTIRRATSYEERVGAVGCFSTLAALALVSLTGPHLTSDLSMPYIAAVTATVELLRLRVTD